MSTIKLNESFIEDAKKIGVSIDSSQLLLLTEYLQLLQKWNSHFNLSAISQSDEIIAKHLLDSLSVSPFLKGQTIADVGTGGGLPGIPLAIVNPDKKFILIDSNGKKTRFLFQVKVALKLANVEVENCRIEHFECQHKIDIVLSRAFASLSDMATKTQHLLENSGIMLAMKGRFPETEIAALPPGFKITETQKLEIPGEEGQRHLIFMVRSS